jgi:hypothetical protein
MFLAGHLLCVCVCVCACVCVRVCVHVRLGEGGVVCVHARCVRVCRVRMYVSLRACV